VQIRILRASTDREIEAAFTTVAQERIAALAVGASPFFDARRNKIVAPAAYRAVRTTYHFCEFAEAGGLMSYGIDPAATSRQIGVYTGRILKGAKPADLPVMDDVRAGRQSEDREGPRLDDPPVAPTAGASGD
jgi:putative tryptophan/tyrosine transport system substrate-binding protein